MRGEELQKYIDSKFITIDTTNKESLYNAIELLRNEYQEESRKSVQNFDKLLNNQNLINKMCELIKEVTTAEENESKLQMNLQALATPQDPQIENWNNKINSTKEVNKRLNTLKRIIAKRKADNNGLDLIPCNGFIISKLLQAQGVNVQYNRYNYTKCYYSIKESTPEVVKIALKDNNNKLHYYTIKTTLEVDQDCINMNLQLLAGKQLKPIFNEDIKGHKEYQLQHLELYNSNALNFNKKRINNKMIEEYTKYFVYKDNTFMSVPPAKEGSYPGGYYEHVRNYNYKIDTANKVILFTDKEV